MSKVLVIADTHISPDNVEVSAYLWKKLGEYAVKTKPDVIVHLGDVGDFNSQAWLKAARGLHTFGEELEAVEDCVLAFEGELNRYNASQRHSKHKLYRPAKVLTLGNHDVRNNTTDVQEMFESYHWRVFPYLHPLQIDDVFFVHCIARGMTDQFCTTAQEIMENWHSNIVVGHGHHRDFFESYSYDQHKTLTALRSPAFMLEASQWAAQTRNKWSLGFTEIETEPFSFVWRDVECL